jgi:hypothetical protein
LLSLKHARQENEENKSCIKTLDLQIWFCSFFVHDSSTEATELLRKSPKFSWGPKLEAFTVVKAHLKTSKYTVPQKRCNILQTCSIEDKDPIEYSRRPASVKLNVIIWTSPLIRDFPVNQPDAQVVSAEARTKQVASALTTCALGQLFPHIPDQWRGQLITNAQGGKRAGWSSIV